MVTKSKKFQGAGAFFVALAFMFNLLHQDWRLPAAFLGIGLILMVISIITKYKELQ